MQAIYDAPSSDKFEAMAKAVGDIYHPNYFYAGRNRIVAEGSLMDHVKAEKRLKAKGVEHSFRLI